MPRLLKPFLILLLLLPLAAHAQPGDSRVPRIRSLREQIAEADKAVARRPANPAAYAARGALYVELHRVLTKSLYSGHSNEQWPDLTVPAIAGSAIADLSRALKLAPSASVYALRGEMYAVRWKDRFSNIHWADAVKDSAGPAWKDYMSWTSEKKELAFFGRFLADPDFRAAAADYTESLRLDPASDEAKRVHIRFAVLYLERAQFLYRDPRDLPHISKIAAGPNKFNYSLLADIDRAIAHRLTGPLVRIYPETAYPYHYKWFEEAKIRDIYNYKATVASAFGRYAEAITAFEAAEKNIGPPVRWDSFPCHMYPAMSRAYYQAGNFDAAIRAASRVIKGDEEEGNCSHAREPRGDAYLAKGDYRAAIDDYNYVIKNSYPSQLSVIYKNRGLAHLRAGETLRAIADLTQYLDNYRYQATPGDYLLRAEAYRKAGKTDLAEDDERRARENAKKKKGPSATPWKARYMARSGRMTANRPILKR